MAHHAAAGDLMQFNEILLREVRRLAVGDLLLVALFVIKVIWRWQGIFASLSTELWSAPPRLGPTR